ncbi:uncharacterized protein LOC141907186 [Tubulanus polymorphus]|uniref:uncharacterized protein LOC141907186 n=1 Tax=Tubulanus polymorphus TaxID=672921 RepID=UPI003DA27590
MILKATLLFLALVPGSCAALPQHDSVCGCIPSKFTATIAATVNEKEFYGSLAIDSDAKRARIQQYDSGIADLLWNVESKTINATIAGKCHYATVPEKESFTSMMATAFFSDERCGMEKFSSDGLAPSETYKRSIEGTGQASSETYKRSIDGATLKFQYMVVSSTCTLDRIDMEIPRDVGFSLKAKLYVYMLDVIDGYLEPVCSGTPETITMENYFSDHQLMTMLKYLAAVLFLTLSCAAFDIETLIKRSVEVAKQNSECGCIPHKFTTTYFATVTGIPATGDISEYSGRCIR